MMSRGSMGKEMTGNRAKKMRGGGLAMISPAAALVQSIQSGQPEGLMRLSPLAMAMSGGRSKSSKEQASETQPTPMKAGGKVTRGDGACMKGRTKGKMY